MKQSQIDKNYLERAKMRKICYDTKNVAELVFTKSISVHDDPVSQIFISMSVSDKLMIGLFM